MTPAELQLKLLFDDEVRWAFRENRARLLEGVSDPAAFADVNIEAVEVDALARRQYLMTALCRSFPLTTSMIGGYEGGVEGLARFMSSPHMFSSVADRTEAFGDHLLRMLELGTTAMPDLTREFVAAYLTVEQALVDGAHRIRADVRAGRLVRADEPSSNQLKKRPLALAPYVLAATLPLPTTLVRTAIGSPPAGSEWLRLDAGDVDPARVNTLARADRQEVTFLARGIAVGMSSDGALVEVSHRTAELTGDIGALLASLDGTQTLAGYPPAHQVLIKNLAKAGFVVVARS